MNRPRRLTALLLITSVVVQPLLACSGSVAMIPAAVPKVRLAGIPDEGYELLGTVHGSGSVGTLFCISYGGRQRAYLGTDSDKPAGAGISALTVVIFLINPIVGLIFGVLESTTPPDPVAVALFDAMQQAPPGTDLLVPTQTKFHGSTGCFATSRAEVWARAVRVKDDGE